MRTDCILSGGLRRAAGTKASCPRPEQRQFTESEFCIASSRLVALLLSCLYCTETRLESSMFPKANILKPTAQAIVRSLPSLSLPLPLSLTCDTSAPWHLSN